MSSPARSGPTAHPERRRAGRVDRISPADHTLLATDVGPVAMNVGALLMLRPGAASFDLALARATLAERVMRVPRLRQRLSRVPWGLGRPVWVTDEAFDPERHIEAVACPHPADQRALLDLAAEAVARRLPRARPLWRALLVTGLPDGQVGLILVLHHVLADGIGGLAVLAALADRPTDQPGAAVPGAASSSSGAGAPSDSSSRSGASGPSSQLPAASPPTYPQLARDRAGEMADRLRGLPSTTRLMRRSVAELGATRRPELAPRSSLNVPTGPGRRVTVANIGLDRVRAVANRRDVTINDVLLVAVTAALEELLDERGEHVPALVVSVPISARSEATAQQLGNQVGVMPVRVPLSGSLPVRLRQVAASTAAQRDASTDRGASAALIGPAFRALAALGLFRRMIDRQRLVNTFLTNLRGPSEPVHLLGATVTQIVPITVATGNVTTSFAALTYAGTLAVAVITDPAHVPEADRLTQALARLLAQLADLP